MGESFETIQNEYHKAIRGSQFIEESILKERELKLRRRRTEKRLETFVVRVSNPYLWFMMGKRF